MKIQISENLSLKQIELSDAPDIFETINSQREYLGKWLPFVDLTKKVEDTEGFIKSIIDEPEDRFEYVFVIYFDKVFAGLIGFRGSDKKNKKTEIGYWLSKKLQKKGIITSALRWMEKFAFRELKMNRIQIKCAVENLPSKNIPIRLGYTFEGIEHGGELLSDGKFTDLEVYSKLKNQYF